MILTVYLLLSNSLSDSLSVVNGVPQGSVIGPLLFIVYITDLLDNIPTTTISKCFADDIKIYTQIESIEDVDRIQSSVDVVSIWAHDWQMPLSVGKCNQLNICSNEKSDEFHHNIIEGIELSNDSEVKDLGVIVDKHLNFERHRAVMIGNAKQKIHLLLKVFLSREANWLVKGFLTYILPLLSYCSVVWSPHLREDVDAIESVLKLFTKRIPELHK